MSETEHEDETTEEPTAPVTTEELSEEEEASEEPAGPEEPADEPAEAPEAQGPTQEQWEKRFKVADQRFKTYAAQIEKTWEDDALHLVRFNLDDAAPPGYIDMRNAGHVSDETRQAALVFLGMAEQANTQNDPYSHVCPVCAGQGVTLTGSLVPNQATITCLDCKGRGWQPTGPERSDTYAPQVSAANGEAQFVVPQATGPEAPEVAALRNQGYTIIPPMNFTNTP